MVDGMTIIVDGMTITVQPETNNKSVTRKCLGGARGLDLAFVSFPA